MSSDTPRTLKRSDVRFSPLGFGAAPIGNLFSVVDDETAEAALHAALQGGIRYFDTAPYYGYGLSERRVAAVLAGFRAEQLTLSTKVGRVISAGEPGATPVGDYLASGRADFDYSRDGILRSFESSLARLNVTRVDVLLLHDVGVATHRAQHGAMLKQALDEALPAMSQLKAAGACRAIGIGVNEEAVCMEVMRHFELDCILLAGRYSLLDHASLDGVMAEAQRRQVGMIIGGPYNSGLLAGRDAPGATYDYRPVDAGTLQRARRLYAVCGQLGVDVGAAALQFALAHPAVVSVVAGMRAPSEVRVALERMRAVIPSELWQALREAGLLRPDAPTP
jgi:D-threo-aldose 1-dehydrogenase